MYFTTIFFKWRDDSEGEIKTFSNKQKLMKCVASRPPLQETLKVFRHKENDKGQKLRSAKALEKE